MKKIILGMALIAAISLGTTVYAQNPQKKEVNKEQTVTKKKAKKTAKVCCKKTEKVAPSATSTSSKKATKVVKVAKSK